MIRRALIFGLVVLAGCSEAAPTVEPSEPSTILLPAASDVTQEAMFIGEVDVSTINEGSTWVAEVVVAVRDSENQPVAGAVISAEWSEGDTEATVCTTDNEGMCEFESGSIRKRVANAVLEITDIQHDSLTYVPELDEVDNPQDQPRVITVSKT